MSNKDLLKLENEFRDQIPKYKEKPNIGPVTKPVSLTKRVTNFLETTSSKEAEIGKPKQTEGIDVKKSEAQVEMDIFITSM